jgi:hypothetical protein
MRKCSEMLPFFAPLFRAFAAFYRNEVIQEACFLLIGASGDVSGGRLHFLWLIWEEEHLLLRLVLRCF